MLDEDVIEQAARPILQKLEQMQKDDPWLCLDNIHIHLEIDSVVEHDLLDETQTRDFLLAVEAYVQSRLKEAKEQRILH